VQSVFKSFDIALRWASLLCGVIEPSRADFRDRKQSAIKRDVQNDSIGLLLRVTYVHWKPNVVQFVHEG